MAVTVITKRDGWGRHAAKESYADADSYVVSTGFLDVKQGEYNVLGTYAPGEWMSAYMDDKVSVSVET